MDYYARRKKGFDKVKALIYNENTPGNAFHERIPGFEN
jgi:hypothetical protein